MQQQLNETKSYSTSLYGLFGYFVMSLPAAIFALMFFILMKQVVDGQYKNSVGFGAVLSFLGIYSCCVLIQSAYQFLNRQPRFVLTQTELVYRGVLGKKVVPWKNIRETMILEIGPYIHILLFVNCRSWSYKLDASGLRPDYRELYKEINVQIGQDDRKPKKWITWTRNKRKSDE